MIPSDDFNNLETSSSNVACRGSASVQSFPSSDLRSSRNIHDLGVRCKICGCSSVLPGAQYIIPEASPAFRETMGKMTSERVQTISDRTPDRSHAETSTSTSKSSLSSSPPSSPPTSPSSPTSLLNKLRLAFKSTTTSSSSSQKSSSILGKSQKSSTSVAKTGNSRRPASFGGVDVVKPWTGRRSSQYEKRVSWADERGSHKALFTVRFIKPRLSTEPKRARQITPGQSILRNSGVH